MPTARRDDRALADEADCHLDDFLASSRTDPARLPARRPTSSRTSSSTTATGLRARVSTRRAPGVQAELARLTDGPGIVVFQGAFTDLGRRRPRDRGVRGADRRPARVRGGAAATTSRSRAPTTGCGTRWRSSRCRDPDVFVDYYANDVIALISDGLARPRLPGHVPGQRGQPGRRGAERRTATTTWASCPTRRAARFPAHVHARRRC